MDIGCAVAGMLRSAASVLGRHSGDRRRSCCPRERDGGGRVFPAGDGGDDRGGGPGPAIGCELVEYHELPEFLKDNEFILRHYRAEWPLKQTLLSIFSVHNETVNIWTHLAGFLIFLLLALHSAVVLPEVGSSHSSGATGAAGSDPSQEKVAAAAAAGTCLQLRLQDTGDELEHSRPPSEAYQSSLSISSGGHITEPAAANCSPGDAVVGHEDGTGAGVRVPQRGAAGDERKPTGGAPPPAPAPVSRWPFFAFLCGSMLCLLTSSACHLISCHSEPTAYLMLRLDYAGIAALIVTSFYPLVFYSFLCDPFFCNLYMGFIAALGAVTVSVSLAPAFQTAGFRPVRAGVFFLMGVSGLVPMLHKLVAFGHRPEVVLSAGYELLMGAFYGLGVVIYAARIPERWTPGRYDVVGHSHQLFHVLVVAGAVTHYLACRAYLQWRDVDRCLP